VVIGLVIVGFNLLSARARKGRPRMDRRIRLLQSSLDAWTAAANQLGLDLEPVYPHRISGRIGRTQVDATVVEGGVFVLGTNASMPGKFRLQLVPEGIGAAFTRSLGKKDVHIDAHGEIADDQSELDARFAISTSSITMARRVLKSTGDRLVPFDRAEWTIEDGDIKMYGPLDDWQAIERVIPLVAALADACTAPADHWTKLAGELGGSVDHLARWTLDGTLPPIALVRGSESFQLFCDLDEDRLRLVPDRAPAAGTKWMTFASNARAKEIGDAADAFLVGVSDQEGMAYRG
jgi:hypothetical protein